GYTDGLAAIGAQMGATIVETGLKSIEDAERATTRIFGGDNPPTAVFAGQNYFTMGAIKALRTLGLHRKIAVIGFDDFPVADLLDPAVTVVEHDPAELGRTAAGLLFRRLDGDNSPSQHIVLPVRVVPRGS